MEAVFVLGFVTGAVTGIIGVVVCAVAWVLES